MPAGVQVILTDLDSWVLARCPLNGCADRSLQYWVFCIITYHVICLHQLLVAEVRIIAELENDLKALQTQQYHTCTLYLLHVGYTLLLLYPISPVLLFLLSYSF